MTGRVGLGLACGGRPPLAGNPVAHTSDKLDTTGSAH